MPCTTQTCLLVWTRQFAPGQVYPACLEKGTDREGTVEHQTLVGMAEGAAPQCPVRGHAGETRPALGSHLSPTALWGSVPWLAAMRIPRLYSVTLGSGLCLGSVQNVALPCKIATARHGVHLLYQKHKIAAVTTPCKAPRVTMVF